jgi:hypothetical protein
MVTSALPYANGPSTWAICWSTSRPTSGCVSRNARPQCHYVCADDAHGTAIMLKAEQNGITPENRSPGQGRASRRDFADFLITFDNYHSTHSPENREFSETIYQRNRDRRPHRHPHHQQLFDPEKNLFLADRFIKGDCPKCAPRTSTATTAKSAAPPTAPTELKNPRSTISGATPVMKESLSTSSSSCPISADAEGMDPRRRPAGRSGQQAGRVAEGGLQRLGHFPRCTLLRLSRFPAPTASISTSGSMRPSATWPASRTCARASLGSI